MPVTTISNTSRYVNTRTTSSNPRVNGKYVANSTYLSVVCHAPPMVVVANGSGFGELFNAQSGLYWGDSISVATQNRLYGKLRDTVTGPKGELLTSAVEWKTSLDMISGRSAQILAAFQAVRKLKLKKAAKILNISTPSKVKSFEGRVKGKGLSVTQIWLEYWMGWAPLCGDIAHAIETLTDKPNFHPVHFSVSVPQHSTVETRSYTVIDSELGAFALHKEVGEKRQFFSVYGDFVIINHNYRIADQLGFTNPALTLWQILPFSFMIDWFANVGTVLGSLTDFAGVEFSNTGQSMKAESSFKAEIVEYAIQYYAEYPNQWPLARRLYLKNKLHAECHCSEKRRTPGPLPTPRLNVLMLDKLSLTRAATTVSLLNEIFLRK